MAAATGLERFFRQHLLLKGLQGQMRANMGILKGYSRALVGVSTWACTIKNRVLWYAPLQVS